MKICVAGAGAFGIRHLDTLAWIDVSKVDVSMNGIELQDREFVAAIRETREPNASFAQVLPAMRILDRAEKLLLAST